MIFIIPYHYDKSLFHQIIDSESGIYDQKAKFRLALTLAQLNDYPDANKLINELIVSDSEYPFTESLNTIKLAIQQKAKEQEY